MDYIVEAFEQEAAEWRTYPPALATLEAAEDVARAAIDIGYLAARVRTGPSHSVRTVFAVIGETQNGPQVEQRYVG